VPESDFIVNSEAMCGGILSPTVVIIDHTQLPTFRIIDSRDVPVRNPFAETTHHREEEV
jgi:hypothetical protein